MKDARRRLKCRQLTTNYALKEKRVINKKFFS